MLSTAVLHLQEVRVPSGRCACCPALTDRWSVCPRRRKWQGEDATAVGLESSVATSTAGQMRREATATTPATARSNDARAVNCIGAGSSCSAKRPLGCMISDLSSCTWQQTHTSHGREELNRCVLLSPACVCVCVCFALFAVCCCACVPWQHCQKSKQERRLSERTNETTKQRNNERTKQRTKFSISQFQTQHTIDICKKRAGIQWDLLLVVLRAYLLAAWGNFSPGLAKTKNTFL